jgi:hypothetical protein
MYPDSACLTTPQQHPHPFRDLALALSARFARLRSEDAEAMTKWAKLTDEEKARLREVDAEQRADEEVRDAQAGFAISSKKTWDELPLSYRRQHKVVVSLYAGTVAVLQWLLGVAVWLLMLVIVGVLAGVAYLLYLWMQ